MKPIETIYRGYRFRSRLEARWAVFFDSLGLSWEYEPEGFELSDGTRYLPDFKLTSKLGEITWVEIKPKGETYNDKFEKFKLEIIESFDKFEISPNAVLFDGDPKWYWTTQVLYFDGPHQGNVFICPRCGVIKRLGTCVHYTNETRVQCDSCDFDTPCGESNEENGFLTKVRPIKGLLAIVDDQKQWYVDRIEYSCDVARGARFEHGERG